jgi:hypothetical protein
VQLTLALLEQPAAPATPGVPLDPKARAKAIEILVRMIAQTPCDIDTIAKRDSR